MKRLLILLALCCCVALVIWPKTSIVNSGRAAVEWLPNGVIASSSNFAQATGPMPLQFPQDLGAHNDYQTEWWYYTGNLATESGRRFGYQLTFFRRALSPELAPTGNPSHWRSNQIYFAHFTISDIEGDRFYPTSAIVVRLPD